MGMRAWRGDQRGAASILAAATAGVIVVSLLLAGAGSRAVSISQRTSAAADLAALAAANAVLRLAVRPCSWAERTTTANGARLVECRVHHAATGTSVEVLVRSAQPAGPWGRLERSATAGLRPVREDQATIPRAPP